MPKAYESMKARFKKQGLSDKASKAKAAKIFNARRKKGQRPVTRKG